MASSETFKDSLGLELVGPFELLEQNSTGSKPKTNSGNMLTQWRFYYDPPEFQVETKILFSGHKVFNFNI